MIYCFDNCHVWPFDGAQDALGSSSLCTCEAHRVAMYGHPINYNPFGPHPSTGSGHSAPQPPAPDVPLSQFKAAQDAGATHLSGDGKTAYMLRMGRVCWADWSEESGTFGGWWESQAEQVPAGAVVLK